MKILFILALLAFTAISANATTTLGNEEQGRHQQVFPQPQPVQQPFPHQQPFLPQWQQPIPPQQQQTCQQQQQTFPQPWPQPFPQPWQQPFPQPFPQPWQQPLPQQPPFIQPSLQQQLSPCRDFLLQQCSPLARFPFLRSQTMQQSSCQVMRQQCCQQLAQIPVQFRYQAIQNVVHNIIMQQQQQLGQGFCQPQQLGQGIFVRQQQQQAQFQVLQTLSAVCNVNIPVPQFSGVSVSIGGS